MVLKVNNLTFDKDSSYDLRIKSLKVKDKQIVSVICEDNFYKKTLFDILSEKEKKYDGEIFFDNINLSKYEKKYKNIIFVDNVSGIFNSLTVLENLNIVAQKLERYIKQKRLKLVKELMPELFKNKHIYGYKLDVTEKILINLSRIILVNPKISIIKDPTSGFYPLLADRILEIIKYINKLDISFLILTKKIDSALKISDWLYILEDGKIVSQGDKDAFIKFGYK
ncbi:MAG: ATP-binding cassette domain-containing protein [Clostridiales bacterium]|jgi:branched-chain amino acid transport system ATP-binding protein|nr:ATP-binding cassette domain-containing protein [Clostridiales bacterium]